MRAPIHSRKHYVQTTLTSVLTGAEVGIIYLTAVNPTSANLQNEVGEGAIVKAIFVEIWAIGTTADQFFTAILAKLPGGVPEATIAQMAALDSWENKKNILYTTQGLASNDGIAAPIPLIRQFFKIPKSKQRFGLGDKLVFQLASRGDATIKFCGFATYKEYT